MKNKMNSDRKLGGDRPQSFESEAGTTENENSAVGTRNPGGNLILKSG